MARHRRLVVYALFEAEEKGITQKNLDEMAKSEAPYQSACLGATPGMARRGPRREMGLQRNQGGRHYGEIFDKHLGLGSPLKIERGYNNLWTKGGLIYAMPIR